LRAPDGAIVTLAPIEHPIGSFYLQIALDGGAAVTAVLAEAAIKVVKS